MPEENPIRPVRIVTDSTADIPPEVLEGLPITVVPLLVEIAGAVYRDMVDLTREEFLARLIGGETPKTSQPSIGDFQNVFADWVEQGFDVVSIHLSPKLSGTYNSAVTAARNVSTDHITVIDSGSVSIGLGMLALEAASHVVAGQDATAIADHVRRRRDDVWVVAALETLEYLRRGGRIGPAAAFLGSALQIKPVVQVRDGEILPLERVRTFRRALDRLLSLTEEQAPFDRLAVLHLGAHEGAQRMVERLMVMQPGVDILLGQMGTVVGTYGGPGILGIAGLISPRDRSA